MGTFSAIVIVVSAMIITTVVKIKAKAASKKELEEFKKKMEQ